MSSAARALKHTFVVVGGVMAFWGILAAIYLAFFRVPQRSAGDDPELVCDFGEVYDGVACASPLWIPITLAVLGAALAVVGAVAFQVKRREAEDLLRAGAGTRLVMAILASLAVGPLLYAGAVSGNQGDPQLEEWIRWLGTAYGAMPVFFAASLVGTVSFVAAFGVHLYHDSLRKKYLDLRHYEEERQRAKEEERRPPEGPGNLPPEGFRWESL